MNSAFDDIMILLTSVVLAVLGTLALVSHSPTWNQGYEAQKLLVECEKDLPRNLKCEIVAVKPPQLSRDGEVGQHGRSDSE